MNLGDENAQGMVEKICEKVINLLTVEIGKDIIVKIDKSEACKGLQLLFQEHGMVISSKFWGIFVQAALNRLSQPDITGMGWELVEAPDKVIKWIATSAKTQGVSLQKAFLISAVKNFVTGQLAETLISGYITPEMTTFI